MNKDEFLVSSGLQVQTLELWIEQRWLIPDASTDDPRFSDMDVARVRMIRDLKADLGVNDEGVDVILHLIDQIHGLRRVLTRMHAEGRRSEDEG